MLTRFSYATCLSSIAASICTVWLFSSLRITTEDRKSYQRMMQENRAIHTKSAIEELPIEQTRRGVQKDFWQPHNGEMRHFQTTAKSSRFTLVQRGKKVLSHEVCDQVEGLFDNALFFQANNAYFDGDLCFLEGKIQVEGNIEGKKSVAYAESAYLDFKKRQVILQSIPSSKVTVCQEGLTISAPRVEVGKIIESKGNLHIELSK